MTILLTMISRNVKLFFKDKGMFFTSLITPTILLVLYSTFLSKVYRDSFVDALPETLNISKSIIDGLVGGQLISSILAVSCITVAFSANFIIVQDKATGTIRDLTISPIRSSVLSISYFASALISTLIICFTATAICLIYIYIVGWYMSFYDIILLFIDVLLLSLFGTALSSVINNFLKTQGQLSATSAIVSAGYGFICGAYMPISSFDEGLQKILSFLPGTYGTSLIRSHSTRGVFLEMQTQGIPKEVVERIKDSIDCNTYFFENRVDIPIIYVILSTSFILLVCTYIAINYIKEK